MTEEHVKQIGSVKVNFSLLEFKLKYVIWQLVSEDNELGKAITSGMMMGALIPLYKSLCHLRITEKQQILKIKDFVNRLNKLVDERNKIVHSVWGTSIEDPSDVSKMSIRSKGFKGMGMISEKTTPEGIKTIAHDLLKLSNEIMSIHGLIRNK
jgi:hypothetical protein